VYIRSESRAQALLAQAYSHGYLGG
jgi:hypothetical protein